MLKKELTKTSQLLVLLAGLGDLAHPFININELKRRVIFGGKGGFESTVYRLYKRGLIKFVNKNSERFVKITSNGEIEALISKAHLVHEGDWDGKWRLVIFDIPEDSKDKRSLLRKLLKSNGFKLLQASVYINPFPLNRDAITYLKEKKLYNYIRLIRIDEIDDDKDLRIKFNL